MTDDINTQQAYMEQAMKEMDAVVRNAIGETDWTQTTVIDVVFVTQMHKSITADEDIDIPPMEHTVSRYDANPPRVDAVEGMFPHRPVHVKRIAGSQLRQAGIDPETGEDLNNVSDVLDDND